MKSSTLIVLLFFFIFDVSTAQYTQVPDTNFEQFLEDNGMGDGIEGNGQVLTANIEDVTELIINDIYGIQDLTGIEDFSALELLGCSFNPVSQLDLSQNTHLKILGLFRLLSLENLDLTGLEELQELYAFENLLQSITLGSHPNLTYIDLSENLLSSLDVSQCPALEYLDVTENYLSELDVSHNLSLEQLWTPLNPLNYLDTSQNLYLEVFFGAESNITKYDFTQNPNLRVVGIGNSPDLISVDIRNGNNVMMEQFHVGQSENLECIFVDDTSAPYMENWNAENGHFVNNEDECEALQTDDVLAKQILLFPNPVNDKLTIVNPDFNIKSIKIMDVSGRIILTQKANSKKIEIDFSGLAKGIYFVSAESENGANFKTEKIIKK